MKKLYNSIRNCALLLGTLAAAELSAQTYCIPTVSFPTTDDDIAYVMFGSMSNTTTCGQLGSGPGSIAGQYSNFTGSTGAPNTIGSIAAPVCIQGMNYPLSVGLTMCNTGTYNGIFVVFIDYNQNGVFTDPGETVWTSPYTLGTLQPGFTLINAAGGITIPFTATPGLTRMRVWESETSIAGGPCSSITWGEVEDYLINIVPPVPCNNTPSANSLVSTTTAICPGASAPINIAASYTVGNITYTWASASNSVGPFVAIPNATNAAYTATNVTVSTWYQLIAGCANGGSTVAIGPNLLMVAPTTTNDVPYYEGFEGIGITNNLPNCSWTKTSPTLCQTYTVANNSNRIPHTGNSFASFYYTPAGTNYFYSNGIQLYAGVTYSASMWFTTEYYGYNTWNLNMMVGPNQSTTGLVSIANLTYAASPNYKQLNNTFTVATSGLYYVAIKAISNGVCCGNYLSWDDLSITIPCQLNTPTLNITTTGSNTICAGQSMSLTATGANTYTWNTGAITTGILETPNSNTSYTATGTSTLTNCQAAAIKNVIVNPSPIVSIVPSATAVCDGSPVNLIAFGANNYTWSTTQTGAMISVIPTGATSTYSLNGSNMYNCVAQAIQAIAVNPLPTVTAQSDRSVACVGEPINLTAGGAANYQWVSNMSYYQGSAVVLNPNAGTIVYTVTGTDVNGCFKSVTVVQEVYNCVGMNEHSTSLSGLAVYPNPNNGNFSVELNNGLSKTIEIMDMTGRMIFSESRTENLIQVNVNHLANGIYYVRVKSDNAVEILKVVKQ
jgi:hypothetical protein